jgi:aerobic carbon-monoxide dehydrogenase large subunit
LARADVDGFSARRRESEARGCLRGCGFAYHIKGTGGSPSENVDIRFEPDGTVSLITGTQTIGQGHETTFPQILADRLGIPNECIRLVQGDTDRIPLGGGHGSSRATFMGGTAIWHASEEIIAKGRIAADALEAAEADIRFADGSFVVAGTDRSVALIEVAALARDKGTGTRCTTNPLGVKGCGEAGAIAAFPAIVNAISDALAPCGIIDFAGPATPERIWRASKAGSLVRP